MRRADHRPPFGEIPPNASAQHPTCGVVIVDASCRPIWVSADGIQILTYPDAAADARQPGAVAKKIKSVLLNRALPGAASAPAIATHVRSGRRTYSCRVLALDPFDRPGTERLYVVILERNTSSSASLAKTATEVGLTPRERQALTLLGQGLTTRQMAAGMGISPNTVKAFLRVIMMKMNVSSRSNILGRVLAAHGVDGGSRPQPARHHER